MYRFMWRPRWIVSHVIVLALIVGMFSAMMWQLSRLDDKRTVNAVIAARADVEPASLGDLVAGLGGAAGDDVDSGSVEDLEFRSVVVDGTYDTSDEFSVPNRTLGGAPGRFIVTPLRWSNTEPPILVLRGFAPQVIDDNDAPIDGVEPPAGPVRLRGWIRVPELPSGIQASGAALGSNRYARMDIARIEEDRTTQYQPVYLQLGAQEPETAIEVLSLYPLPERSEGPHFSYAVQWGIFMLIALVGYPLVLRRVARAGDSRRPDDVPAIYQ